jgi:hypothetical protein
MSKPTITHIAAPWISINGRLIQRCGVCGEKLIDSKNKTIAIPKGMKGDEGPEKLIGTWQPGALVRATVDQNPTQFTLLHADEGFYPEDGCIESVEA